MCNEMGQINKQPGLTRSMLQANKEAGLVYVGWFSGDMGIDRATSLTTASGFLTPTGKEFYIYLHNQTTDNEQQ